MHSAPTRPIFHKGALAIVAAITLIATLLAFVPPAHAQNQPPIADAGPDAVYPVGPTLRILQGFRSFDIDDNVTDLTFRWTVVTPLYSWLHVIHGGLPVGSEGSFVGPSQNEVNRYGDTIVFRLTVTDPSGAVKTDTVTIRFEGPPTAAVAVTALRPAPDAEDLDRDDCEDQDQDFSVNAVIAGPNQAGNAGNEWDVKEGACLTLRGIGTLAAGATGVPRYRWQKISAVPNRSDYNVPPVDRDSQTFSVLLPDDFESGRGAILHYTLTVTSPAGVSTQSTVRINVVDEPGNPTVALELLDDRQPAQDANALNPDAPTLRYVVEPGVTVQLVALGEDPDARQASSLAHEWSGPGVEQTSADRPGTSSRATITIPDDRFYRPELHRHRGGHRPHPAHCPRPNHPSPWPSTHPQRPTPPATSPPKTAPSGAPTAGAPCLCAAAAPTPTATSCRTAGSRSTRLGSQSGGPPWS